ncbi:MAG: ATPase domain-containing protein, partial [Candidatus Thermoplasmatota archaeon]|nr:ATPase domain-containing protein [Candidatus Thermoplasmatota archaeon]
MQKLSTGVYGLNPLLGGGINPNSTTVVIGSSGAGKTTMATQFLRRGLEKGEDGIFITLDEAPK